MVTSEQDCQIWLDSSQSPAAPIWPQHSQNTPVSPKARRYIAHCVVDHAARHCGGGIRGSERRNGEKGGGGIKRNKQRVGESSICNSARLKTHGDSAANSEGRGARTCGDGYHLGTIARYQGCARVGIGGVGFFGRSGRHTVQGTGTMSSSSEPKPSKSSNSSSMSRQIHREIDALAC